jgi:hypothetical protein
MAGKAIERQNKGLSRFGSSEGRPIGSKDFRSKDLEGVPAQQTGMLDD